MTVKEQDLAVEIVHGCFTDVSNSILSVYFGLSFSGFASEAAIRLTSFLVSRLNESHDLSGCACAQ